ncbi:Bax inhibitor-1/YccA family protein [bacterium]|nr:Bax inhibitor-1/YccA family protein [bacterium]
MKDYFPQEQATALNDEQVTGVLRNTYTLLALTLLFSAVTAGIGMAMDMPPMGLLSLVPYFILLFLVEKFKNSGVGIALVFALTGWLGLTIAPFVQSITASGNGDLVYVALGGTALIFFALSGYVLTSRKDLSFMGGFLCVGVTIAFIAGIAAYAFDITGLSLAVSCMFLFLSSGMIAWQTSRIIHGGETNYISATVLLFVSIYNIFTSLLHLLYSFTGE